jgi:hypothetical protein
MNWSALTKKQQQMAIATVALAVVQILLMAHFLGWFKPASARGGSAKKTLTELNQKLESARIILGQDASIRRELLQSIEKLEALTVHAPTLSDRYAWAYEYVSRCATQARVELDSLEDTLLAGAGTKDESKESGEKKGDSSQSYEVAVSTRCGYNNLVEFIWRLEKDNPLLRIKEVTISAIPGQNLSHQVRIVMQWPSSVKIERGML